MKKYDTVKLTDIATIERAIKGKIYPAGTPMIALSASIEADKGGITFLVKDGEIESRYAAIMPSEEFIPKYIYYAALARYPEFFYRNNTGINLQIAALDDFTIRVHWDKEIQKAIIEMMENQDARIAAEEEGLRLMQDLKRFFIDKMFA